MSSNSYEFNKDELEAPEWLNEALFLDVLQNAEKSKNIEIINLKLSPATSKGDHYASVMFRATVDYRLNKTDKNKSMILKIMPEIEGSKKEMLEDSHIFETEIGMYSEVIPKFESILRAVGDKTVLGPPCLYYALSPRKIIIFEDIVPAGYTVLRGRQATLEEVKAAYTKIAKWHAISYKINLEDPKFFDKYRYSMFSIDNLKESPAFKDGITNFIEMLGEHADLAKYKKYFEPLEHNIISYCEAACNEYHENPISSGIYVLCHGDFHFKNLMFKHNSQSNKLEDVMLLDFQMCNMGPIGNDIMYSLYMLLSTEHRAKHLDEVLYDYFITFQETLRPIGFKGKIPKIIEFKKELMRHKNFELFLFFTFLPMWDSITDATYDADDLLSSVDKRKALYKKQKYVDEVRSCLPKYLYKGYLEN